MSAVKRRDNKNRILNDGEYQDADGRYRFSFYENGRRKCFYSWRLVPTDPLPAGKRECVALRDQEAELRRARDRGLAYQGGKMTVLELAERYTQLKTGVRHTTRAGYQTVLNILKNDPFGAQRIDLIKPSDAKLWLIQLQKNGRRYSSIQSIRGVLRPAFEMAVEDDLILKNPFAFQLATVLVNDSVTREAITQAQEREFLRFVKEDKHFSKYYDAIYILFKTGLRISEFCGLTINDVDLQGRKLNIDHQLQRTGKMEYVIVPPKTSAGIRVLPINEDVCACFQRIIANRPIPKVEPMVDGYTGFLYLDKNGMPMVAMHWAKYFQHIVTKYNKIYRVQMPKITPHVCRHTYCSSEARRGVNPKTLEYLMGHSDISVTLDTYTHFGYDEAKAELERLELAGTSKSHSYRRKA